MKKTVEKLAIFTVLRLKECHIRFTYEGKTEDWNPSLSQHEIADEWSRLTFPDDESVNRSVAKILLDSHPTYQKTSAARG